MLALSLAILDEIADKRAATEYYRSLAAAGSAEFNDVGNLAVLLINTGDLDEARTVVLNGIRIFPAKAEYFAEIARRIVEATDTRISGSRSRPQ